jgi:hypothetical protein
MPLWAEGKRGITFEDVDPDAMSFPSGEKASALYPSF